MLYVMAVTGGLALLILVIYEAATRRMRERAERLARTSQRLQELGKD